MYQLACNFVKNNPESTAQDQETAVITNGGANSALAVSGLEDTATTFAQFNVAQTDLRFVLEWKLTNTSYSAGGKASLGY